MHFKVFAFVVLLFTSCMKQSLEEPTFFSEEGVVATSLDSFYSHSYSQSLAGSGAVLVDDSTNRILQLSLAPLEIRRKYQNPMGAKAVLSNNNSSYLIAIGQNGFQILGDVIQDFVTVGAVKSAAYDADQDILVVEDSHGALSVTLLDDFGHLNLNWVGGPFFEGFGFVNAGAILPDKRLALSLKNGNLAIVDVLQSLSERKWRFEVIEVPEAKSMSWIAAIPGSTDNILIGDENQLFSFNVKSAKVIDRRELKGYFRIGASYDAVPHVLAKEKKLGTTSLDSPPSTIVSNSLADGPVSIFFSSPEGVISEKKLDVDFSAIVRSWFYDDELVLLTCANGSGSCQQSEKYLVGTAFRFRTSDNLLMGRYTENREAQWTYADGKMLLQFPSKLGYVELRELVGSQSILLQKLSGFNAEHYRNR